MNDEHRCHRTRKRGRWRTFHPCRKRRSDCFEAGFPIMGSGLPPASVRRGKNPGISEFMRTDDWREVVANQTEIAAELIGGTTVKEIIRVAIANGKSTGVTANVSEPMAPCGKGIQTGQLKPTSISRWKRAWPAASPSTRCCAKLATASSQLLDTQRHQCNLHPHRNGAPRRVVRFDSGRSPGPGIRRSRPERGMWMKRDARSKLAILAALAFHANESPQRHLCGGDPPHHRGDFDYAHQLGHTIRPVCGATQTSAG